jgi:quinol monooxygenase YgiN
MGNVIFTVKYKLKDNTEEEYLKIAKELKAIVKAEGLLDYQILKLQGKNEFCEMFVFENQEAYENYDDDDEMLTLLLSKLSELIVEGSMEYSTYENYLNE